MFKSKTFSNQSNQIRLGNSQSHNTSKKFNKQSLPQIHFKKSQSIILDNDPLKLYDISVQKGQIFKCFNCCTNSVQNTNCNQCHGKGFIMDNNPLVLIFNDYFNSSVLNILQNSTHKQLTSYNSSLNSSKSDDSFKYCLTNNYNKNNQLKTGNRQKSSTQRNSLMQFMKAPFQQIIKEQSTCFQQKCKKCNICQFQFDNIKYTCQQCQNYNVCQQCYNCKQISHGHNLKKILSISSKKQSKHQEQQIGHYQYNIIEQRKIIQNQNTHSQVDKLQIKSYTSSQQQSESIQKIAQGQDIFNLQNRKHYNNFISNNNGDSFIKLQQIACDQQDNLIQGQNNINSNKSVKSIKSRNINKHCHNCDFMIQDCFWICQTCHQKQQSFQLCKDCYDNNLYTHPPSHSLGLNFFTLDSMLFDNQQNSVDLVKQRIPKQSTDISSSLQFRCNQPLGNIINGYNSNISSKNQAQNSNIGVITHRNIFTGFHKQNDMQNQMISPIPRSINNVHRFKHTRVPSAQQSDSIIIPELMIQSSVSSPALNKLKQKQIINSPYSKNNSRISNSKDQNINQSRVLFDDNIIMDSSTQYNNSPNNSLNKSLRKSPNRLLKRLNFMQPMSPVRIKSNINPQKQLQDKQQQDYTFINYCCDICGLNPIKNVKYHCEQCNDYDLCQKCYKQKRQQHEHDSFVKDDGKVKNRKIRLKKQNLIRKAIQQMNNSISPLRKSVRHNE